MTTPTLHERLAEAVGAAHRTTRGLSQFAVDGVVPEAAVFPSSSEEVSRVVKLAAQERLAILPRGGGTAMGLGDPPELLDEAYGDVAQRPTDE